MLIHNIIITYSILTVVAANSRAVPYELAIYIASYILTPKEGRKEYAIADIDFDLTDESDIVKSLLEHFNPDTKNNILKPYLDSSKKYSNSDDFVKNMEELQSNKNPRKKLRIPAKSGIPFEKKRKGYVTPNQILSGCLDQINTSDQITDFVDFYRLEDYVYRIKEERFKDIVSSIKSDNGCLAKNDVRCTDIFEIDEENQKLKFKNKEDGVPYSEDDLYPDLKQAKSKNSSKKDKDGNYPGSVDASHYKIYNEAEKGHRRIKDANDFEIGTKKLWDWCNI